MADTATARSLNVPRSKLGATDSSSPKSLKKKTPEREETVMSNGAEQDDDVEDEAQNIGGEDGQTETAGGISATGETNGEDHGDENSEEEGSDAIPIGSVDGEGNVVDGEGHVVGKVNGTAPEGSIVDTEGDVLDAEGNVIGKAEPLDDAAEDAKQGVEGAEPLDDTTKEAKDEVEDAEMPELVGPFGVQDNGQITNASGVPIGKLVEGEPQHLVGQSIKEIDEEGKLKAESGSTIGKAELNEDVLEKGEGAAGEAEGKIEGVTGEADEKVEGAATEAGEKSEGVANDAEENAPGEEDVKDAETPLDFSILERMKVNKVGKVVNEEGIPIGQLIEGDAKKLVGKKVDAEGKIWNDAGKVIGRAEPFPNVETEAEPSAPFEDFPDSVVDAKGNVIFENRIVGKLIEGDAKKLEGKKVDEDGEVLDKNGNTIGKAERYQEEEPEPDKEPDAKDVSSLEGKKVNKAGNVVDDSGKLFGKIVEGDLHKLIGKKCDAEGKIWSDSGKVIGRAELIPIDDRDNDSSAPFEDFPNAVVDSKGNVIFEGQIVGKLIEGSGKQLAGKKVDKDGEVVDKVGNVLGKAERWTEPDEPEPETVDNSQLAGKRVNKLGNVVDSNGQIYGRLVSGDPKKLAGKMCNKNGDVLNEMGDVIGKAELVPEAEREGEKTGLFADFDNPTVTKDGKVVDAKGSIIGRLIEGDVKKLFGKPVDADGDVLDKNGNTLGKAERWEEEEKEVSKHPAAGRKVNKQGNVVDENGDVIAKLTDGEVTKCAGKEIDNDGDVVDSKGSAVGHVTLLEDIPEPEEPKESEEQIAERKQIEEDKKLANRLASCIEQSIDKIKPILKMVMETIEAAERQPKEELDEQKLVDTVRPLLEEGGQILQECNGAVRALDPDGRIQNKAKHNTASRDASPEEYRLAEQLKELTSSVMTTIDKAKKKIAGMPHAKKELNPLWGLLAEPLGQIIAAVGLLLSGVLGLVGKLLGALGLGGLLDNLLGGLGIKGILEGLGLGTLTKSLTGKK